MKNVLKLIANYVLLYSCTTFVTVYLSFMFFSSHKSDDSMSLFKLSFSEQYVYFAVLCILTLGVLESVSRVITGFNNVVKITKEMAEQKSKSKVIND